MSQPPINLPADFNLYDGYACFHPAGEVTLADAVGRITSAIGFCRENGIGRLLVDATQLGGFPSPSVADRYWIARGFALEASKVVVVSFALQAYLLDPERFGVTVATNLGMKTSACSSKDEALSWLLSQPSPGEKSLGT